MATILSSAIGYDRAQSDSRRRVRYDFVVEDNLSVTHQIYSTPKLVSNDFDAQADIASQETLILSRKSLQEENGLQEVNETIDPLVIALDPSWSNSKKISKALIRWMMRKRDPLIVIWLKPLLLHLNANYTDQQLENFLDISSAQLAKMKQKTAEILNTISPCESAEFRIYEAANNSEDIS